MVTRVAASLPSDNSPQFPTLGQQSAVRGSSTTVSHIRRIQHLDSSARFGPEVALNWLFAHPLITPNPPQSAPPRLARYLDRTRGHASSRDRSPSAESTPSSPWGAFQQGGTPGGERTGEFQGSRRSGAMNPAPQCRESPLGTAGPGVPEHPPWFGMCGITLHFGDAIEKPTDVPVAFQGRRRRRRRRSGSTRALAAARTTQPPHPRQPRHQQSPPPPPPPPPAPG
jgi:hypothetical protein